MADFDRRWRRLVEAARRLPATPLPPVDAAGIAAAGLRARAQPAPLRLDWRIAVAAALVAGLLGVVVADGSAAHALGAAHAALADLPRSLPRPPRLPVPDDLPTPAALVARLRGAVSSIPTVPASETPP